MRYCVSQHILSILALFDARPNTHRLHLVAAMNLARIGCCPNDAVPEVLDAADYISHKNGGKGCVRDVIEQVLKVQDKWGTLTNARNDSK